MDFISTRLSYYQTGYFSKIITDYLDGAPSIRPFYEHPVSMEGIRAAIRSRQQFPTDRQLLVSELKRQYQGIQTSPAVHANIDRLASEACFTITTAHQPAIFTGNLYFIYKILHAVRLAAELGESLPEYQFVPVFYMGCEDADVEELGKIYLDKQEIRWDTQQKGAVGRMKIKGLEKIIDRIEGEFAVQPFGKELVSLLKESYLQSENIQAATFHLLNALFADYGLVVLIPDNPNLKKPMTAVFEDDLCNQGPFRMIESTIGELSKEYKVQAHPREINLFYLKDDLRGRIEKVGDEFRVLDSELVFSRAEMKKEMDDFPDRFSPNVILRGLFQETILPNIAFLGGGGETAYWLEFKAMFNHYKVPFPVLILRNSFLIIEEKWCQKMERMGLTEADMFKSEDDLVNSLVKKESRQQLDLEKEIAAANDYYEHLKTISHPIDPSLSQHVEALQSKALKPILELEKKFLKAERRKFEDQQKQIAQIRSALFPFDNLQERVENFIPYYAQWGRAFLDLIYKNSLALEQELVVLKEN